MGDEHGHEPGGLAELEMLGRRLMDQEFILVVTPDRLDALKAVMSQRKEDEEVPVCRQSPVLDLLINCLVPMIAMGENPLAMPEVGQCEPILTAGFEDIKDDEQLRILKIDDGPVPIIPPVFIPDREPSRPGSRDGDSTGRNNTFPAS